MTQKKYLMASVVLVCLLVPGCRKEVDTAVNGGPGTEIVFGASTLWQNDVQTRTEYSGRDERDGTIVKTSQYERIDWSDGTDMIRVLCEAASGKSDPSDKSASYVVSGVSTGSEKQKSEAGIVPADGNSLQWGTGSHTFYAMYPAAGMESNYGFTDKTVQSSNAKLESVSGNRAKITGVIPSSQEAYKVGTEYKANMNYAYMYATTTVDAGTSQAVLLSFKPLVTAVEVTLKAGDAGAAGMTLKRASLLSDASTGTDLTGGFEATVSSDGTYALSATGTGRRIDIAIPEADRVQLKQDDLLKVTFLALALDQTALTLEFTFDKGGEEVQRKIALRTDKNSDGVIGTDEWISVGAGKKIYVTSLGVPGDVWHYTIEDVEDIIINGRAAGSGTSAIKSYRSSGSTKEYVDVTFQYSADGTNYANGLPSGLTGFTKSGTTGVERTLTANVGAHSVIDKITQKNEIIDHAKIMAKRTPLGSASNPYDLSMHTVTGTTRSKPVTANSYIVSAPGTYSFPLVYGNAIDGTKNSNINATAENGGNTEAYKASNPNSPFTPYVRFDGNTISRPYILWDLSNGTSNANYVWNVSESVPRYELVVLWQDVPEDEKIISQPVTIMQYADSYSLGHDVIYAVFTVDETVIDEVNYKVKGAHQGNFVIALRVAAQGGITVNGTNWPKGTIIWSWHIWVTDNAITPIPVKTKGSTVKTSNDMMPYHLGWCDEKVYKVTQYKTRTWYVKATQTSKNPSDAEPQSTVFQVIQRGENIYEQIRWSAATCYQWGRKDPFLPGYNTYIGTSYAGMAPEDFQPTNKPWSSPVGLNIAGDGGVVTCSTEDLSLAEMIRQPYVFNIGNLMAYNVWNANAANTVGEDRAVVKTVYDPCPPGYSLPHMWAFSNFNKNGTNAVVGEINLEDTNAKDVTGDGQLTAEDFTANDGWYFYTGYGDNTIFFPGSTGRVGANLPWSYVRYFHNGYMWTAARQNRVSTTNGGFDLFYSSDGAEAWVSGPTHALTVHPVAE